MSEQLQIAHIKFKAGSIPGAPGLDIEIPNVTILVGPNNSGKSQTLREIEDWCRGVEPEFSVVDKIELTMPDTYDELISMLKPHLAAPPKGQITQQGHFWIARPVVRQGEERLHQQVSEANLRIWFDENHNQSVRQIFVRTLTLRLDGRTRFDLAEQKPTGPLENSPENHLWALFTNDAAREKVRSFTEEAFGRHFVIDPTGMKHFRVRLSDRAPKTKTEEQSLNQRSRTFHQNAPLVSDLGDGLRTSIGLVSAVMSLPHRILLIDEPEAFLHPTLARRVGRTLAETARERDASLVVATHSSEFLMGCIQAAPELRLVRLTYSDQQPSARSIEPEEIAKLMNDPLLRSADALRALFHRGVLVTEADSDRAFYEEINHRLLHDGRGVEDGLFMNAQNWQTIPRVAQPLRKLGIPAAAIFDFDVLMDDDFGHLWPLLQLDKGKTLQTLQNRRGTIKGLMKKMGRKTCKKNGVLGFDEKERTLIVSFINEMRKYGVFFVPVGELECWVTDLEVSHTTNKSLWLTAVFEKLGSDPSDKQYVTATKGDVWDFIEEIESWIKNPTRLGIPK